MGNAIQGLDKVKGCNINDITAPPVPRVRVALATAGLGDVGRFRENRPAAAPAYPRDPAYIEIGDWEPGTRLQLINKSADPTVTFDRAADVITLEPTGRDIDGRIAAFWIPDPDMQKMKLGAGHSIVLRAIDDKGNVSEPVTTRLQGAGYGTAGQTVHENSWVPASRIRLLDGENTRKDFVLRHIADNTPPEIEHFKKEVKLLAGADGSVKLQSAGTLEADATVQLMNGRTGKIFDGRVSADQKLEIALGKDVKDGDSLFATIADTNGVRAEKVELRYSSDCKDGKGSTLGILSVRLKGAIK